MSNIFSNIPGVASLAIILLAVVGTTVAFIASAFWGKTLDSQTWNLLLLIDGTAIGLVTGQGIGAQRALRTFEMDAQARNAEAHASILKSQELQAERSVTHGRSTQFESANQA